MTAPEWLPGVQRGIRIACCEVVAATGRMAIFILAATATLAALPSCGGEPNSWEPKFAHGEMPTYNIDPMLAPVLDLLMDAQAAAATPQFKKIGAATYTDEDFTEFAELGRKIGETSKQLKDFSKGPAFDALAARLNEKAAELSKAAESKSADAARAALLGMKTTCNDCHSKFR
jgi:soluble cytochrome b562